MASSMRGPDGNTGRRGESASLHGEPPIGVAVIGCGSIANPHFAGWQRLEQPEGKHQTDHGSAHLPPPQGGNVEVDHGDAARNEIRSSVDKNRSVAH